MSKKKKELLYREANALFRTYSSVSWIACSVFYSAAFAIVGLTWEETDVLLLMIFAIASGILWGFGQLISNRFQFYCDSILNLLWRLEEEMGLNLHLHIKRRDKEANESSRIRHYLRVITKIRNIRYLILFFLLLIWAFRIYLATQSTV